MPSVRLILSLVRRFLTLSAVFALAVAGTHLSQAQSLHITPPIYNVTAVNGPTSANILLSKPQGVAVDAAGNLYVADTNNKVVRKVSPTQTATIFAGSTTAFGSAGDGGPANIASLRAPTSLAVDSAGNVYISDPQSFDVRKVTPAGIISTVVGGNGAGSSGDNGLATSAKIVPGGIASDALGNLYVIDSLSNTVRMVSTAGIITTWAGGGTLTAAAANNGPATAMQFANLTAVAVDTNGNLYIADRNLATVSVVNASGIITPFAGNGVSGFSGDGGPAVAAQISVPQGLSVDASGNVYIADAGNAVVRVVNSAGIISTPIGSGLSGLVLDGTQADHARISSPSSVAADNLGNLYIAVSSTNAVYQVPLHNERFPQTKLGATSQPQRLMLENLGATNVQLGPITLNSDFALYPGGLANPNACVSGKVLQAGFSNSCTLDIVFTPTAEGIRSLPLTIASNDTPGTLVLTLTSTGLGSALAMTSGQLYIVGGNYSPTQTSDGPAATGPSTSIRLSQISGLAVDSTGNIFFTESAYCLVERIDGNTGLQSIIGGTFSNCGTAIIGGDGGDATAASMPQVGQLALDANNNLYVADDFDGRIRLINTAGKISTFAGLGVGVPPFGTSCGYSADGTAAKQALLCNPQGMTFDTAGNMFFAEKGNNLIRKISTSGVLSTIAGVQSLNTNFNSPGGFSGDGGLATSAQINEPQGVAVNSAGDVFFTDTNNYVVRKVSAATGKISTIAGQHGVLGYSGDGGLATAATLSFPEGISLDAAGDIFVVERGNWTVRKIDTAGIITTVAGNQLSEFFNGDGLPATESGLSFPDFAVISPSGYLYIGDTDHELIREMSPNGSLLFPSLPIGTTSNPESVTLSNIGNMPMNFEPQFPTGISGDFALASGGTCNFSAALAVGASCNINLTFTPTTQGTRTGIFGFFDDGVASPQYVALSGVGAQAQPQRIVISPIPNHVYGDPDFNVSAAATSGLPVTLTVKSGNATISGNTVHITGIGPVVIAANQAGSPNLWLPATETTKGFNITPAALIVAANSATSEATLPLVPLTYTITGFVYGETASVVSGAPVLTSTVTTSSPVGSYPISISLGTLHAANYIFTLFTNAYYITPYEVPDAPVKLLATATIARSDTYHVNVTITNSGGATATNVVLTSVKLHAVAGTPANKAIGSIPAGGSVVVTISVPLTAGTSGASVIQQIAGTYTGGSFGGTGYATLP
ncbi:MAG TPA: choice-of-anchor D domain-containing protein [Acidobacteriaceae bacterium]|nr:choice-of-anchor D domain-containing protein [Acidobacteriaceae bacterium]